MLTLTKDIVIADSLYAEKIIFLPSLGHHSMDIIVGVNLGGLGQRNAQALIKRSKDGEWNGMGRRATDVSFVALLASLEEDIGDINIF